MAKRVNPTLVGAFVLGAFLLVIAAILVLGGENIFVQKRRFVIYFGSWSALIQPSAQRAVAAAAAAAKRNPAATVSVTGYASTIGSSAANTLLSQLRAQIVSDELVADGIGASRIKLTAAGPTTFMVEPVASRRVVIQVGGQ